MGTFSEVKNEKLYKKIIDEVTPFFYENPNRLTLKDAANEFGYRTTQINGALRYYGFNLTQFKKKVMLKLFNDGFTHKEIAKMMGYKCYHYVTRVLNSMGAYRVRRPKKDIPKEVVKIWLKKYKGVLYKIEKKEGINTNRLKKFIDKYDLWDYAKECGYRPLEINNGSKKRLIEVIHKRHPEWGGTQISKCLKRKNIYVSVQYANKILKQLKQS